MELGVTAVMLPEVDFDEQIELCVSLGIRYYQYRPRIISAEQRGKPWGPWGNHRFDLTPERLRAEGAALTGKLRKAGMAPWGTVPAATVDDTDAVLRLHFEGAVASGAGRVRVGPPAYPEKPFDYPAFLDRIVARYRAIVDKLSRPLGIKLIIETHTGSIAASPGLALHICRHFDPAEVGVIFDIANFNREGELKPHLAVSVLRPYIDCVHLGGGRRIVVETDELGCKIMTTQFCSMEESDLHIPSWLGALKGAGIDPPIIIEDFAPRMSGPDRLRRDARFLHAAMQHNP
jgi:sugar phosphate isomerase/epimerase